jgi:hypothetical protein
MLRCQPSYLPGRPQSLHTGVPRVTSHFLTGQSWIQRSKGMVLPSGGCMNQCRRWLTCRFERRSASFTATKSIVSSRVASVKTQAAICMNRIIVGAVGSRGLQFISRTERPCWTANRFCRKVSFGVSSVAHMGRLRNTTSNRQQETPPLSIEQEHSIRIRVAEQQARGPSPLTPNKACSQTF